MSKAKRQRKRIQKHPTAFFLQESSEEAGTEEAGGDLEVGSSARSLGRRAGGTRAGGRAGLGRAIGLGSSRAARASSSGGCVGGSVSLVDDGGGVVCGDNDLGSAVVAEGNDNGVDAGGLSGNAHAGGKRSDGQRLGGDGGVRSGLGRLGGSRSGHASDNA